VKDESTDGLLLEIPLYRVDVKCEADVVEEILRIYGYNNIEITEHVNSTFSYLEKPDPEKLMNMISDMLTSNGFAEIMCNSLNPSAFYDNEDFSREELVILSNPLSSDLNAMRQSLLYGGLSSIVWNINRQNPDLKLYEFGNTYFHRKSPKAATEIDNYSEKMALDLFITGRAEPESWNSKSGPTDFFRIKSFAEMVMSRMGLKPESLISGESDKKWFSESVVYRMNNNIIAETGKISKLYLARFDISQDVFYAHIEWDRLISAAKEHRIFYQELPKYPAVRRDLALLLDKDVTFRKIRDIAFITEKNLLQNVHLFDVYESESLGKNKKSYAVSFTLQDNRKTLTDKNIEKVMSNLISAFEKELKAQIRK
jgi:phenylalanyl-tRNA synthetase beta chain